MTTREPPAICAHVVIVMVLLPLDADSAGARISNSHHIASLQTFQQLRVLHDAEDAAVVAPVIGDRLGGWVYGIDGHHEAHLLEDVCIRTLHGALCGFCRVLHGPHPGARRDLYDVGVVVADDHQIAALQLVEDRQIRPDPDRSLNRASGRDGHEPSRPIDALHFPDDLEHLLRHAGGLLGQDQGDSDSQHVVPLSYCSTNLFSADPSSAQRGMIMEHLCQTM